MFSSYAAVTATIRLRFHGLSTEVTVT